MFSDLVNELTIEERLSLAQLMVNVAFNSLIDGINYLYIRLFFKYPAKAKIIYYN